MNLEKAIKNINRSITKKQPETINPQWIKNRCKASYKYIADNIKDELGEPDWDFITARLDRKAQRLWLKGNKRRVVSDLYEDKDELNLVLDKFRNELYFFVTQTSQQDRQICDQISIRLVRMTQKGNVLARKELMGLMPFVIDQWVEGYKLRHWMGYDDLIIECLERCIRKYRYSGSFLGYLYRTLEYRGRALKPLESFSLNQPSQITERVAIDNVVKDMDTGKITICR